MKQSLTQVGRNTKEPTAEGYPFKYCRDFPATPHASQIVFRRRSAGRGNRRSGLFFARQLILERNGLYLKGSRGFPAPQFPPDDWRERPNHNTSRICGSKLVPDTEAPDTAMNRQCKYCNTIIAFNVVDTGHCPKCGQPWD